MRKLSAVILAGLVALSLGGCSDRESSGSAGSSSRAGPLTQSASGGASSSVATLQYVRMAASSDAFEVQSSRLALQRSRAPQLRAFAEHMVSAHTASTNRLKNALQADNVPATPQLEPMHQQMLTQLQAASGAEFDRLYRQMQVQAHQQALQLHQQYAQNGDNPTLRNFAQSLVPEVQQHTNMISSLAVQSSGRNVPPAISTAAR